MKKTWIALLPLFLVSCKGKSNQISSTTPSPDGPVKFKLEYKESEDYEIQVENPSEDSTYLISQTVRFKVQLKDKDRELVSVCLNDHELIDDENFYSFKMQASKNEIIVKTAKKPVIDESGEKTLQYVTAKENDCTFDYIPRITALDSTDYLDLYQRDFPIYSKETKEALHSFLPGDRIEIYKNEEGKNSYGLLTRFKPAKGSLVYEETSTGGTFYLQTEDNQIDSKQVVTDIIYENSYRQLNYSDYEDYKGKEVSVYYSDVVSEKDRNKRKVFGIKI